MGNRSAGGGITEDQNLLFALDANTGAPLVTESKLTNGASKVFQPIGPDKDTGQLNQGYIYLERTAPSDNVSVFWPPSPR